MQSLSVVEARVLGSLMEKETTTPEYYPLSLNALISACNQKSSRDPAMELGEAEVRSALFGLEELGLVRTLADGRVSKFEHLAWNRLNLRRDEVAVICLLLLRGPQTAAELRARAERLYAFDDVPAVGATLARLAAREEPLTRVLERQPGAREPRWMHLLVSPGAETTEATATADQPANAEAGTPALLQRMEAMENALHAMEARLKALEERIGAS